MTSDVASESDEEHIETSTTSSGLAQEFGGLSLHRDREVEQDISGLELEFGHLSLHRGSEVTLETLAESGQEFGEFSPERDSGVTEDILGESENRSTTFESTEVVTVKEEPIDAVLPSLFETAITEPTVFPKLESEPVTPLTIVRSEISEEVDLDVVAMSEARSPKKFFSWEPNAPKFKGEVSELLDYFDNIIEYAEAMKITEEKEKKNLLLKFADRETRLLWESLDEFADDTATFEKFIDAIKLKYPELMYRNKTSLKELMRLVSNYNDVSIDDLSDLCALERDFGIFISNFAKQPKQLVSNKQLCDLWLSCFDGSFKSIIMNRVDNTRHTDERITQIEDWMTRYANRPPPDNAAAGAAAARPAAPAIPTFSKAAAASRTDEDPVDIKKLIEITLEIATAGSAPYRTTSLQTNSKEVKAVQAKNEALNKKLQDLAGVQVKMEETQTSLLHQIEALKAEKYRQPVAGPSQSAMQRQPEQRNAMMAEGDAVVQPMDTVQFKDPCYHCGQIGHMARNCGVRQRQLDEGIIIYKFDSVDGKRKLALKDGSWIPREPLSQWPAERIEALKSRLEIGKASSNFLAQAEEYGHDYPRIMSSGTRGMFLVSHPQDSGYNDIRSNMMNPVGMNGMWNGNGVAAQGMPFGQFMQQPLQQGSQFMPIPNAMPAFNNNMMNMSGFPQNMQGSIQPYMNQQFQMPQSQFSQVAMQQQQQQQGVAMTPQNQFMQQQMQPQQMGQMMPQMMNAPLQNQNLYNMPGFAMQNAMQNATMPQFMQQNQMGMIGQPMQIANPVNLQTRSGRVGADNGDEDFQDDQ